MDRDLDSRVGIAVSHVVALLQPITSEERGGLEWRKEPMIFDISSVFLSVLRFSNLKPSYYQREAPRMFLDAFEGSALEVAVLPGCEGMWLMCFVHEDIVCVAVGACDACNVCYDAIEMEGPSITNPAVALLRWMHKAVVVPIGSLQCESTEPFETEPLALDRLLRLLQGNP